MSTKIISKDALSVEVLPRAGTDAVTFSITANIVRPNNVVHSVCADIYPYLLRSGCGKYSRATFLEAESTIGSTFRITATSSSITLSCVTLPSFVPKALSLATALLTTPHFKNTELARIKKYIQELYKNDSDDGSLQSKNLWYRYVTNASDNAHPYTEHDLRLALKKISRVHLQNFHTQIWSGPWVATYGGNPRMHAHIEKFFTQVRSKISFSPQSVGTSVVTNREPHIGIQALYQDIPHRQNIEVNLGNVLPISFASKEYAGMYIALSILGLPGGFTGRLMSTVREQEGLTYGIYAFSEYTEKDTPAFWRVKTFFSTADIEKGIRSTYAQISLLHRQGVTDDELRRFKRILHTRRMLAHDSILKAVRELHTRQILNISPTEFESFHAALQSLTKNEVNTIIKTYLNPKNLVISFAGPLASARNRIEKLVHSLP